MPNHVRTVIKMSKLSNDTLLDIINECTSSPKDKSGLFPVDNFIDFDKIIPEPRTKEECPEKFIKKETDHIMPYEDRPWFNWYDWHCKYWYTKWNAYDGYIKIGKTYILFIFSTAWSPAMPIFHKLAETYDCDIDVKWADEDWGANCGWIYRKRTDEAWTNHIFPDQTTSYRFAKNLWKRY